MNLDALRGEYAETGRVVVPGFIPRPLAERWRARVLSLAQRKFFTVRNEVTEPNPDLLDEGGQYNYKIMDGVLVQRHFPEMMGAYAAGRLVVSYITGEDVVLSPYPLSAVNIKIYETGGEQSAHFDTNPITGLLYLSDNFSDGATQFADGSLIQPQLGSLAIFKGREQLHSAASVNEPFKIACPWNYYTAEDQWRPDGMDALVYGGSKKIPLRG